MSRFLVVTWDGAGNLVSTLAIAERLAANGHDVRLLGHRSIDERCGSHGWRFRPFTHTADFDSAAAGDLSNELTDHAGAYWFSADTGKDVIDELEREPADVLIVDCMLFGALSAGEASGVPTVALFHAPFSNFRGGPMVDMLAPAFGAVEGLRADLGLPAAGTIAAVHDACALSLVVTPREFEMDMPLPANVRFVGPILDGPPLGRTATDLDLEDGPDPVVLVSFSTSFQRQHEVVQGVVTALGDLAARVVVTTGHSVAPESIDAADNTTVARFVPHSAVLPRASVLVTHAGLGTVMAGLSHGVPMVCMPMGRDQFFNAMRVEALGAGRMIAADSPPDLIRQSVEALLGDAGALAGAKQAAEMIASYGGGEDAVRELERLAARR
jgi:MGT family glycosyltransferase